MTLIADVYRQSDWPQAKIDLSEQMDELDIPAVLQVFAEENLVLDVGQWDASVGIYDNEGHTVTVIGTEVYGWADSGQVHLVGSGFIAPQGATVHLYGPCRFDERYAANDEEFSSSGLIVRHDEERPAHLL